MIPRRRLDWSDHGHDFGNCVCRPGMGMFRKNRPRGSHPSSSCGLCAGLRGMRRKENRTDRYFKNYYILEGLNEYES